MLRFARAIALIGLSATAAACAAITGLGNIREDSCIPDGCDASAESAPVGDDTGADTQLAPDTTTGPRDSMADVAIDSSMPAEDSGETGDAGDAFEAAADVWQAPEAATDSSPSEAQPTDTGSLEHVDVQTPPDSPTCTIYYSESFTDGAPGWTLDSSWTAANECASPPKPDKGNPDPTVDHTSMATGGGVIGVYVCGNNPKTKTAALYATSPVVDISAAPAVDLTFYRWLNSDESTYMTSTVDVFDGSTWRNLYQNTSSALVTDSVWTKQQYDVTAYKNAAFQVRFGYSIPSASVYAMSCWNVDDVTLSTPSCP